MILCLKNPPKTCIFALPIIQLMIQRIQSLYLLLVLILSAILIQWAALWRIDGTAVYFDSIVWLSVGFYLVAALALISILQFKKRQNQFVINRLNIILNLFLLGFFVYRSLNLSGETGVSEKGIGMLIPIFSIVLLVLANRAIKKDEDLVKSVDRLR